MRSLLLILFLLPHIPAEKGPNRQTNLDDIERDNIRSEKLAKSNKNQDIFEVQQSQGFHTKNLEYYRQQLKELKELQEERESMIASSTPKAPALGGVAYATPSAIGHNSYNPKSSSSDPESDHYSPQPLYHRESNYQTQYQNEPVQYTATAPNSKIQYQGDDDTPKAEQDESSKTYSAQPVIPSIASYFEQYRQPHYVYVPSNRIQPKAIQYSQHVANDIQYAGTAPGGSYSQLKNPATPATITYSHDEGAQDQQHPQQYETGKDGVTADGGDEEQHQQHQEPIQQSNYQLAHSEDANQQDEGIQYVPYIGQGPSPHQSYVTMVAIPHAHGHNTQSIRFTPSVVTYSHSGPASVTPVVGGVHPAIQYIPTTLPAQPTGPLQYVNSNDLPEPVPTVQYTSQQQDIQYADPEQSSARPIAPDGSKQFKFAPKHPERPEPQDEQAQINQQQALQLNKIQYLTSQRVLPLQQQFQYYPQPQINVQPLHQFQPYREPKSLLESYVPSWIVIQRQQQQQLLLQQQQLLQQQRSLHQQYNVGVAPQPYQYNTIAYSTQQQPLGFEATNHIKRSAATLSKAKDEKKD